MATSADSVLAKKISCGRANSEIILKGVLAVAALKPFRLNDAYKIYFSVATVTNKAKCQSKLVDFF